MNYVIIGASAAGAQACEELRRLDPDGRITLISEEEGPPYSRCLISRFVDGRLTRENLYFRTSHFYDDLEIQPMLGRRAHKIDRAAQKVLLDNGTAVPYDKLLIATGARPYVPDVPGMDLAGVYRFHSLTDAQNISKAAQSADSAVVAGAGFAGLEAAYALRRRGLSVTVVERCPQILPNQLDLESGEIIRRDLESMGVELVFNQSIASISCGNGAVDSVLLANNTRLKCGMVVFATGIRPNKELAAEAGLMTDRGIRVDDYMQTNDPDIYAAGDVIEINDVSSGKRVLSATWLNAVLQGRYAAYNMAGKRRRYAEGVGIQNAVQFHRIPAISFGQTLVDVESDNDYEVMSARKGNTYKKLILKGGRIIGMIFVGDIAKSGFYAALIRSGVEASRFKQRLLDDDFSHAILARELNFGQYDPYKGTAECWNSKEWWAERPKCIAV